MSVTRFETPIIFDCEGCRLVGIVAAPPTPLDTGVVIIVGGPQYRAGSHRQFTLLARHLAEQGVASIRFDYRGMGDSEGDMRNFENIDADIHAAIDALMRRVPTLRRVVLWGLCDAAAAALYYGPTDARVSDLILLNPWVHTPGSAARARMKHYYLQRLLQISFWKKILSGHFRLGGAVRDLAQSAQLATTTNVSSDTPADPRHGGPAYVARMREGMLRFHGKVLVFLSGNDLTAQEFMSLSKQDKDWKRTLRDKAVIPLVVKGANHTFSSAPWRAEIEAKTLACIAQSASTR